MTYPIHIPLLNSNEPEALLSEIYIAEGQFVRKGDLLCSLETTKSSADVAAEQDGYVTGLRLEKGQTARAGELLCYLAPTSHWELPAVEEEGTAKVPEGMRITRPALEMARRLHLDLSALPSGSLITEAVVRAFASQPLPEQATPQVLSVSEAAFDPSMIVIYGGGGHGKMVIDMLRARGTYQVVGIIDDGLISGSIIMGVPVLGGADVLAELHSRGVRLAVNAIGGIGDIKVRIKIFERLAGAGFVCPAITHISAYIDPSAHLEAGAQVLALAYVGSEANLGYGSIVNTAAIVSHDCRLEDFAIISPGAMLAGDVQVGEGSLIGMGATVNLGVKIGRGARLGNGATVKSDVPEGGIVRAGAVWPG
jgi:sugar O-acyltransferase (sialic acid O-acetyltransferase NeuD family)